MKHLRLYESINTKSIIFNCQIYGIKNYSINKDGSIDVDGDVDMSYIDFEGHDGFPLNFRNISGRFTSRHNRLTSLSGGPKYVGEDFSCSYNRLASLEGCPESIVGNFYCHNNQLISLKGCPESVGGDFYCYKNKLTSFEGCSKLVCGDFYCEDNNIVTFEYLPFSMGGEFYCANNPINHIWKLFRDYSKIEFLNDCDAIREPNIIILDRLNYFLEEIGKPTVTKVWGYKCI